ncbi:MAG: hypothetical protein JST55_00230 [Bacteroidetes bacterium]|nr:hypothetical protein [Bacteroidota bacterium]
MKNIYLLPIFFLLFFSGQAFSQLTGEGEPSEEIESADVSMEQMLGMFDGIINEDLIDNISEILPNDAVIVNYGAGDFSGEGMTDITISYKTKSTPDHKLNVIFLINEDDKQFKVMKEDVVEWVDVPYDVAFSISEGTCVFTYREGKQWRFQRYFYYNDTVFLLQDETID